MSQQVARLNYCIHEVHQLRRFDLVRQKKINLKYNILVIDCIQHRFVQTTWHIIDPVNDIVS